MIQMMKDKEGDDIIENCEYIFDQQPQPAPSTQLADKHETRRRPCSDSNSDSCSNDEINFGINKKKRERRPRLSSLESSGEDEKRGQINSQSVNRYSDGESEKSLAASDFVIVHSGGSGSDTCNAFREIPHERIDDGGKLF